MVSQYIALWLKPRAVRNKGLILSCKLSLCLPLTSIVGPSHFRVSAVFDVSALVYFFTEELVLRLSLFLLLKTTCIHRVIIDGRPVFSRDMSYDIFFIDVIV